MPVLVCPSTIISNRKVTRAKLVEEVLKLPNRLRIGMEACAGAHHWGRTFEGYGFKVLLIPPQHVKAFSRVHKSDGHDAIAIAEAMQRPNLHAVPVKSLAQQELAMLIRVRERFIRERTRICNQLRAMAAEMGFVFEKKITALKLGLNQLIAPDSSRLSVLMKRTVEDLLIHLRTLDERIDQLFEQAQSMATNQPAYARLQTIPGIGPVISVNLMAAVGNGHQFDRGRSVAAWLGLVPRQNGSGGHTKLQGITKNGDRTRRALLIHGARAVLIHAAKKDNAMNRWLLGLEQRRGRNRTVVALANKLARIAWRVLRFEEPFAMARAFKAQHPDAMAA